MARKRKSGARTKKGRLSRAYKSPEVRDNGTPEVQAKRLGIVGEGGDPALSATSIGTLFARGYVDKDQYTEGLEYGRLWNILYGPVWRTTSAGTTPTDERIVEIKRRLKAKDRLLTQEQREIVTDICGRDHRPMWFYARQLKLHVMPEDVAEQELLVAGLNALLRSQHKRAV